MSRSSRRLALVAADLILVLVALSSAGAWAAIEADTVGRIVARGMGTWALFGAIWFVIARRLDTYSVSPSQHLPFAIRRTFEAWGATWGIAGLLCGSTFAPQLSIWMTLLVGTGLLLVSRLVMSLTPFGEGTTRPRGVVIGSCPSARALTSTSEARDAVDFVGFVPFANEDPQNMPHLPMLGVVDRLSTTLREREIDVAFVSPSDDAITGEVHHAIDTCEALGLQVRYFPSFLDVDDLRVGMAWSANRPGLNVQATQQASLAALGKRAIDVAGALVGIMMLAPVMLTVALAVKLTSRGPMLFRQTRVGQGGRTFDCLKFRTMRVGAHAQQQQLRAASQQDGPAFKIARDPRVTPVGRLLRKFSIDELPQLFNVLLGDMSLVGPRPPIPSEVDEYTWWQRRRISIKPGLTCVWQVYGRNRVSFKRWVEMDLYYIDNWSLWMDLKLILHTMRVVVRGTGM